MIILGISGKRESGKSLLASYLEHYYGWTRFSLADELKKKCMQEFKLMPNQLWGKDKEVPTQYTRTDGHSLTARDIMIRMGVFYRSVDQLYWCKKFDPAIGEKIVIDDIRFFNEIQYFKDNYEAKFVRLYRSQEAIGKAALDDLSETELDAYSPWDWELAPEHNLVAKDLEQYADYLNTNIERSKLAF